MSDTSTHPANTTALQFQHTQYSPYSNGQQQHYQNNNITYAPPSQTQSHGTTGADFLAGLLIFGVVVILPAFLVCIIRANNACSLDNEGGWVKGFVALLLGTIGAYIILVSISWDNKLSVGFLLGLPIAETITVTFHVFLIIFFSKFFSLFIKPIEDSVCLTTYGWLFAISIVIVNDVLSESLRGDKSWILRLLS